MRVLQAITTLSIGGAEKLVSETLSLFHNKGIDMDVFILKSKNTALEKQVIDHLYSSGKGSVYNPLHIFKIIPYLRKYDVIHVHLFPTLYWVVAAKLISFSKIKIIYTEHSTNNKRRKSVLFKFFDRLVYSVVDKIITISKEVDEELKNHLNHNKIKKISLIYNGINFNKFNQALPYDKKEFFNGKCKILIQVSSFRYPKDQITLIKTLNLLPEQYKLILVGDGPNREECEELVEKLNLKNRIVILGLRNDVERLLKTSDVIILSSAYEGMSLSSIEGMAAGRPFIATKVPGLTSIVENYGVLFELGNFQELKNIILQFESNEALYNEVSSKCIKRAQMFSLEHTVENYIEQYHKILEN